MKRAEYRISKHAIEDLNNIWVYTFKKWSKLQADRYYKLIIDEIQFIAANFYSGKPYEDTRKNYRMAVVKSHLIFYRKSNDHCIEIVRILNQRMDIKKHLN